MNDKTYWLVLIFFIFIWGCESAEREKQTTNPPNIILFIVDDMGWQDTSVPFYTEKTGFNKRYQTPSMKQLAQQGMVFTNAYAASPVCTPTRSSIITGKSPARTHITDWTLKTDVEAMMRAKPTDLLRPPMWAVEGVQPDSLLLPALLSAHGYRTIHVGKAHFGALGTPGANPENLGFDVNIAGHAAGSPGSYFAKDKYGNSKQDSVWGVPGLEEYYGTGTYLTKALTLEANKAIDKAIAKQQPFYLHMAHYAVHVPLMADMRYFNDYLQAGLDSTAATYASMIEGMDASLGRILQNLQKEGVADNTIIIFASDNGGLSAYGRGTTPMGTGLDTHNKPLRSGKGSAYEGGIRVPLIVAWADRSSKHEVTIPKGSRNDTPVISTDLFPTILDLAHISYSGDEQSALDGQSLVPLLVQSNGFNKDRALYWHYPHKWGPHCPGCEPFTAIRKGPWKLIFFYPDRHWELYNLKEDIGEHHNRVKQKEEVAKRLAKQMRTWMMNVDAQTPILQRTGEPVPLPRFD